jgi:hypothetical protein
MLLFLKWFAFKLIEANNSPQLLPALSSGVNVASGEVHQRYKTHENGARTITLERHNAGMPNQDSASKPERDCPSTEKAEKIARLTAEIELHKKQIQSLWDENAVFLEEKNRLSMEVAESRAKHKKILLQTQTVFKKQIAVLKEERDRTMREKVSLLCHINQNFNEEHLVTIKKLHEVLITNQKLAMELAEVKASKAVMIQEMHGNFENQVEALDSSYNRAPKEKSGSAFNLRKSKEVECIALFKQNDNRITSMQALLANARL